MKYKLVRTKKEEAVVNVNSIAEINPSDQNIKWRETEGTIQTQKLDRKIGLSKENEE